jgi:ketosteroid isomerase-like protein
MASEGVAVIEEFYARFNKGEDVLELCDPEIEFHEQEGSPFGGIYRGLEELGQFIGQLMSAFEDVKLAVDEIFEAGEHVLVAARFQATVRATGQRVDLPYVELDGVREDKIIYFRPYIDTALLRDALETNEG